MAEGIAVAIGMLAFLAVLILVAAAFHPRNRANRRRMGWWAVASLVVSVGALATLPTPPDTPTKGSAPSPTPTATATAAAKAAPAPTKPPSQQQIRAALLEHYASFLADSQPCDAAVIVADHYMHRLRTEGAETALRAAQNGKLQCVEAGERLQRLFPVEGVPESAGMEQTMDFCAKAYALRGEAMTILVDAFDGEHDPARLKEFGRSFGESRAGIELCNRGWQTAADTIGARLPD